MSPDFKNPLLGLNEHFKEILKGLNIQLVNYDQIQKTTRKY
jgi:hypothetical protein